MRYRKFIPIQERLPDLKQLVDICIQDSNQKILRNYVFHKRNGGGMIFNSLSDYLYESSSYLYLKGYKLKSKIVTHWIPSL